MKRKAIIRDFVFTLKMTKDGRLHSSIEPERDKKYCCVTKQKYTGGHNDGPTYYDVPPYRFLSGDSIEDIYSNITNDFKIFYDDIKSIEKTITSDIQGFSQTEIDKYFAIAEIQQDFILPFEYNRYYQVATFPFMPLYKFVNDEVQNELMKYAKGNLNSDEYNTFVEIIENVW